VAIPHGTHCGRTRNYVWMACLLERARERLLLVLQDGLDAFNVLPQLGERIAHVLHERITACAFTELSHAFTAVTCACTRNGTSDEKKPVLPLRNCLPYL
jgi:hypothetical protein